MTIDRCSGDPSNVQTSSPMLRSSVLLMFAALVACDIPLQYIGSDSSTEGETEGSTSGGAPSTDTSPSKPGSTSSRPSTTAPGKPGTATDPGYPGDDSSSGEPPSVEPPILGPYCSDMIDDLEDGDGFIIRINGRQGAWTAINDGSADSFQVPSPGEILLPEEGVGSLFAAATRGAGFVTWGASLNVDLNHCVGGECESDLPQPYDLSRFTGISFQGYSRSNTPLEFVFKVATSFTTPIEQGGRCDSIDGSLCSDHFRIVLSFTPDTLSEDTRFSFPFSSLRQEGWGGQVPFDPSEVLSLIWQVRVDTPFDFAVDHVCLY